MLYGIEWKKPNGIAFLPFPVRIRFHLMQAPSCSCTDYRKAVACYTKALNKDFGETKKWNGFKVDKKSTSIGLLYKNYKGCTQAFVGNLDVGKLA